MSWFRPTVTLATECTEPRCLAAKPAKVAKAALPEMEADPPLADLATLAGVDPNFRKTGAASADALSRLGLGGLTIAEHRARWSHPVSAERCEACGKSGVLVPFGIGPWSWLHMTCWPEWFAKSRKAAAPHTFRQVISVTIEKAGDGR